MKDILPLACLGGLVVCAFATIGDIIKPKSFAGIFAAAPSVSLASLAVSAATRGHGYTAIEARSMIAGAVAFFVYACVVSRLLAGRQWSSLRVASTMLLVWGAVAFGWWSIWLR